MTLQQETYARALRRKIDARTARVGVLGLGYAGFPIAVEIARAGFRVTGLDIDSRRVDLVRQGVAPFSDAPDRAVQSLVAEEMLAATIDFNVLADLDCAVICVPTPLTASHEPDLSFIRRAAQDIGRRIHPGMLVALQSTCSPGTTRKAVLPVLEESGLQVGQDFFLVFAPERIDPGNARFNVKNTPKLVGGITTECTALACQLYGHIVDQAIPLSSPEAAEMAKLVENTFRFINISFANELAILCDHLGVNVWEVIDAAATKPFAFLRHNPGPGVGGECIPTVPFFLEAVAREQGMVAEFIEVAGRVNDAMPPFVVDKLDRLLEQRGHSLRGARVLCLGVTYKPDVPDLRGSASLRVLHILDERGATVFYHDPLAPSISIGGVPFESVRLQKETIRSMDAAVVLTPHTSVDYDTVIAEAPLILDTQNALSSRRNDKVVPL